MAAHATSVTGGGDDPGVRAVAAKAVELVADGARVGLGSGRAASAFIALLGARLREGLRVSGVATSRASEALARQAGIPLIELGTGGPLDLTVDGADEVAPNLDLVKGWGGALVRERIVSAASARQVILVGEAKLVRALGERGPVPVEVIPLAQWLVTRELEVLGALPTRRSVSGGSLPFITDNGNLILDCALPEPLVDARAARELERAMRSIAGVVDTGLFLGTADQVLVGHPDGHVDIRSREPRREPRGEDISVLPTPRALVPRRGGRGGTHREIGMNATSDAGYDGDPAATGASRRRRSPAARLTPSTSWSHTS